MGDKLRAEHWLFLLFVFTLPFAIPFKILGVPVQLSDLLFVAAAGVWLISFVRRRETFRFHRFYFFLAAYAVAVTLSTIFSVDPSRSSVKLAGKFLLIGIAFLTFNIVTSHAVLKRVMKAWLFGAGVVLFCSLLGIFLFYAGLRDAAQNFVVHEGYGSLPPGNYPRIEGLFSYPATLCNFLAITWMFALASWPNGWLRRALIWPLALSLLIVNAFTLTPGLGGIFLATGLFLREKFKGALGRLAFASGLVIAVVVFFVTCVTLFPLENSQMTPSPRVHAWRTSFKTFLENPLLGRGVGMPIANAQFTDPSGGTRILTDAHNTYLSVLGETGLAGFLTFMSIICFVTFSLFRWKPESVFSKTIRLCLLLAMLDAFFYQSLTGSYEDTRHLWVLFGVAATAGLMQNAQCTVEENSSLHCAL